MNIEILEAISHIRGTLQFILVVTALNCAVNIIRHLKGQ